MGCSELFSNKEDELRLLGCSKSCSKEEVAEKRKDYFAGKRKEYNKKAFELLQPALVILDEFHRYTEVLPLVAELTGAKIPLLLLSATPYVVKKDDWKKGDYLEKAEKLIENEEHTGEDTAFSFPMLLRFLIKGDTNSGCKGDLSKYTALWETKNTPAIEAYLKQYIWRNERVSSDEKYLDLPAKEDFLKGKYDDCIDYAYDCGRQPERYFSLCPGAWSFGFKGEREKVEAGGVVPILYQEFKKELEEGFKKSFEKMPPTQEDFLFRFLHQYGQVGDFWAIV